MQSSFVSLTSIPGNNRSHQYNFTERLEGTGVDPRTSDRVIVTPVLPPVLEAVRNARIAAGVIPPAPEPAPQPRRHAHHAGGHGGHGKSKLGAPDVPVRRGGSAPGKKREFALPTVPRPQFTRAQSRVEALKATASAPFVVRPKSASDLLGMTAPSATPSLASDDNGIPTEPPGGTPSTTSSPPLPATPAPTIRHHPRAAWWLDVSCPTWKDLRDIGELLGLHPLTLEDVLHQDPREKLDMYDKLGYYFIVVRALDEQYFKYTPGSTASGPPGAELTAAAFSASSSATAVTNGVSPNASTTTADPATNDAKRKERARRGWGFGRATGKAATKVGEKVEIVEDNPGKEGLEGVGVGGVNLYLVVFADGIVSVSTVDVSFVESN